MSGFGDFCRDLEGLAKAYGERGVRIGVAADPERETVRIFGEGAAPLSRARSGNEDVFEFASYVAEHHPFWGLLYHSSDIADSLLERWESSLSGDDLAKIEWSLNVMRRSLARLQDGGRE